MKNNYTLIVLIVIVLGLVACQSDNQPTEKTDPNTPTSIAISSDIVDGERLYITYCASCHGIEGEGSATDPNVPPHDETGHTWHHDDDLLTEIITDGGINASMPAFGQQLSEAQIQAILEYIKTFWTQEQQDYQTEITNTIRSRQ